MTSTFSDTLSTIIPTVCPETRVGEHSESEPDEEDEGQGEKRLGSTTLAILAALLLRRFGGGSALFLRWVGFCGFGRLLFVFKSSQLFSTREKTKCRVTRCTRPLCADTKAQGAPTPKPENTEMGIAKPVIRHLASRGSVKLDSGSYVRGCAFGAQGPCDESNVGCHSDH